LCPEDFGSFYVGYVLEADLAGHQRLAKVEPLPVEVWNATWDDFKTIKVLPCLVCGYEGKQIKGPWQNNNIRIFCPDCGSEIQR
jgi:hypothetical protein